MDLKVILLIICSFAIFERVNGLEEERIILRLSQIETGLEECSKKNDENYAKIEEYVVHIMYLQNRVFSKSNCIKTGIELPLRQFERMPED